MNLQEIKDEINRLNINQLHELRNTLQTKIEDIEIRLIWAEKENKNIETRKSSALAWMK